jgi:hypothetical protein
MNTIIIILITVVQVASHEAFIIEAHPDCTAQDHINYKIKSPGDGLLCISPDRAYRDNIFAGGFE